MKKPSHILILLIARGDAGVYDAFSEFDMRRVRSRIDGLKGSWLLSCDDSEITRKVFSDCNFVSIPIKYSGGQNYIGRPEKAELLAVSNDIDLSMIALPGYEWKETHN